MMYVAQAETSLPYLSIVGSAQASPGSGGYSVIGEVVGPLGVAFGEGAVGHGFGGGAVRRR